MARPRRIENPRRIMFIGPPDSGVLSVLKDLTGSAPTPRIIPPENESNSIPATQTSRSTTAGLNHTLSIDTKYYTAQVPIWLDELPSLESGPVDTWKEDFSSEEARDVIQAVGAWVVVVRLSRDTMVEIKTRDWLIKVCAAIRAVVANADGGLDEADLSGWDGTMLAVGVSDGEVHTVDATSMPVMTTDDWDDICFSNGFEYIDANAKSAPGQPAIDKVGIARIREAFETNDWEGVESIGEGPEGFEQLEEFDDDLSVDLDGDPAQFQEGDGFSAERAEVEREFAGLKLELDGQRDASSSIDADDWQNDQQQGVEELERMMRKLQAVKDNSSNLPKGERKKAAAKAVHELMRDFGD